MHTIVLFQVSLSCMRYNYGKTNLNLNQGMTGSKCWLSESINAINLLLQREKNSKKKQHQTLNRTYYA